MAKQKERKVLDKANWTQSFNLVGEVDKFTEYTFGIDKKSEKSDWVYNSLNLNVDCGPVSGKVNCKLMGGYGSERNNNVVYVHGKDSDGKDDFKNQYTIDWEDRFDESILEDIGDLCFLTVGLEKDSKDKTFYKKFLTPYDAIAYIHDYLKEGMVLNVKGQLKHTLYNGVVQTEKEINSIVLSAATPDKYRASFTQTMLLDRDSVTKDSVDKDKGVIRIDAYVLEKFKEYNGWDLTENGKNKGGLFVPLRKTFEYEINKDNPELTDKFSKKFLDVKKGTVTQATFEGLFVESGAVVTITEEDLRKDPKYAEIVELIDLEVYTLEEGLAKCTVGGAKERRMIVKKPLVKMVGDDDNKVPEVQRILEKYDEEDITELYYLVAKDADENEEEVQSSDDTDNESVETDDDELAALLDALD